MSSSVSLQLERYLHAPNSCMNVVGQRAVAPKNDKTMPSSGGPNKFHCSQTVALGPDHKRKWESSPNTHGLLSNSKVAGPQSCQVDVNNTSVRWPFTIRHDGVHLRRWRTSLRAWPSFLRSCHIMGPGCSGKRPQFCRDRRSVNGKWIGHFVRQRR